MSISNSEVRPMEADVGERVHLADGSLPAQTIPGEIAFLQDYGVSGEVLAAATERAKLCGIGADLALLAEGSISEERFYRALADRLGVPYFTGGARFATTRDPHLAIMSGFISLAAVGPAPTRAVIAPKGAALGYLVAAHDAGIPPAPIAIASRQRLCALIRAQFGNHIANDAADLLGRADPTLSARGGAGLAKACALVSAAMIGSGIWVLAPGLPRLAISIFLWSVFASAIWLRSAAAIAATSPDPAVLCADSELPVYTVIVAMYRESRVVGQLTRALDALDYPRGKLDIKLVIERNDGETLTAINALRLPARYDVIVAPPGRPRTKPRALNIALAAARGELVVVYDAEDEPAPDQLLLAAARFAAEPEIDALQARLTIANAADSWLSELYAVEYAALFDFVNPGLAALELPIALGGTSNHFRVRALRRVGGWDAWNVTEDIDLGFRLARFGARVGALASDTAEEAPSEFGNWFRQRTRWQKGWMQTLIVLSRHPLRLYHELGIRRALGAAALIGGTVIGGLFGPLLFLEALWRGSLEYFGIEGASSRAGDVVTYLIVLAGAQSVAIPALVAMRARGMKGAGHILPLMPLYYALVSLATWVALVDLVARPFHWSKTEHGRSRQNKAKKALLFLMKPPYIAATDAVPNSRPRAR